MTLRMLVPAALLVALSVGAEAKHPDVVPLGDVEIHAVTDAERDPADRCSAGRTDYYWSIGGWFTGNEVYGSLARPGDCSECGGGWQAVSVTIFLFWECAEPCDLNAVAAIRAAVPCEDVYTPGDVLAASEATPIDDITSPGLWAVTIDLPENAPVLAEPFFATVEFVDDCASLPRVVTGTEPCVPGQSWNDWGSGWRDLCEFGFPGDLSLYTTLQCQGPTPVERNTWTTIKAIYRNE